MLKKPGYGSLWTLAFSALLFGSRLNAVFISGGKTKVFISRHLSFCLGSFRQEMIVIPSGDYYFRQEMIVIFSGDFYFRQEMIVIPSGDYYFRQEMIVIFFGDFYFRQEMIVIPSGLFYFLRRRLVVALFPFGRGLRTSSGRRWHFHQRLHGAARFLFRDSS